ncbi:unnamed protein product [Rotaria sp. Silwood1]|nr:unnamed protein product [Rotaria sp. Silwood1]CAF0996635.1 unnamed protein product [Rotaria sp. Silwood1]CAF3406803.1 unnamed protein product [Rotaria sp. Silwood1]CAF3413150.1 unnamed protein product [Rotaria sp. Silwood1]CAF3419667.1 unnamed protein product [Rotaria sp. Silwood1]
MSNMKRTGFAYFFALIGGLFGLHHLYLGRTQHALLWFTTFGGFGIGILYEILFSIKKYVREANHDNVILEEYEKKMREQKSPAFELIRFCGQYLTALFYGVITYYAFPDTWLKQTIPSLFIGFSSAFAIALGTQLAGTLGPRRCSFIWPLLGALLGLPFMMWNVDASPSFNIVAFFSCCIFEWKVDWNPEYFPIKTESEASSKKKARTRRHFIKRCCILGLGAFIFGTILTSAIYQNLQVDINGERVKVKDVLADFFKSQEFIQLYQQLSSVMKQLYAFYLHYGFKGIWTEIWTALESQSDKQAYEVLNVNPNASQKTIENQCRILSRKWHPDRYRDPEEKQKAEATFMNIQQACNRLSNDRKRRQKINTQDLENPN